jgi:hypothetical protein
VEAEQSNPAGPQDPVKLGQDGGYLVVGDVDQAEPGEQSGQATVGQVKVRHAADLEAQAGVVAAGHVDHRR